MICVFMALVHAVVALHMSIGSLSSKMLSCETTLMNMSLKNSMRLSTLPRCQWASPGLGMS